MKYYSLFEFSIFNSSFARAPVFLALYSKNISAETRIEQSQSRAYGNVFHVYCIHVSFWWKMHDFPRFIVWWRHSSSKKIPHYQTDKTWIHLHPTPTIPHPHFCWRLRILQFAHCLVSFCQFNRINFSMVLFNLMTKWLPNWR